MTGEITPERLAAVEAELARLRAVEDEKNREAEARSEPPPPTVDRSMATSHARSLNQEQQDRQDAAREERNRLRAEWERKYEQQLSRVAPEVKRLEAKISSLTEKERDERARHALAVQKLREQAEKARRRADELQSPPPMPGVLAPFAEGQVIWAAGHLQHVPERIAGSV